MGLRLRRRGKRRRSWSLRTGVLGERTERIACGWMRLKGGYARSWIYGTWGSGWTGERKGFRLHMRHEDEHESRNRHGHGHMGWLGLVELGLRDHDNLVSREEARKGI